MTIPKITPIIPWISIAVFFAYATYVVAAWVGLAGFEVLSARDWLLVGAMLICCIASGVDLIRGGRGIVFLLPVAIYFIAFFALEFLEYIESGGSVMPSFFSFVHLAPLVVSVGLVVIFVFGLLARSRD